MGEQNEFFLKSPTDKEEPEHNGHNSCSTRKRRPTKIRNYDDESSKNLQTSQDKSINNYNNSEPVPKERNGRR